MSVVKELIRTEADGGISFGDYELAAKAKKSDFEHRGDLYKVKTFKEITKLVRCVRREAAAASKRISVVLPHDSASQNSCRKTV